MTTNSKTRLSPTMQIAVTASVVNGGAKATEANQMSADKA